MNAVGIDVSSRKSTVAVLRPLGEVVCLPFDVSHDADGLASLAEKLKAIDGETRVVMEHTGRYYEAVAKALHEAGLFVCAVNPLLIKEYGANSLRRVKTDKSHLGLDFLFAGFLGVIHAFQLAPMRPSTADFRRDHAIRRAFGFDDLVFADVQSDVVIAL